MGLILSEDQLILKETARSFLDEKSPVVADARAA